MLKELRALWPYIARYRGTYLVGMVCVVVSNGLITLGPKLLERGVNIIAAGGAGRAVAQASLLLVGVTLAGAWRASGCASSSTAGAASSSTTSATTSFASSSGSPRLLRPRLHRRPDGALHQ